MEQSLTTERLLLRPYTEVDFDSFVKMHSDPVLKANTHGKAMNRLQARDLFDGYLRAHTKDKFGMLSLHGKCEGSFIGECGLWFRQDAGGYTLRYTILKDHWNNGYGLEAANAVLDNAFTVHDLKHIQAIAMVHNVRSIKVLERVGFVKTSDSFREIQGFMRFVLTKARWAQI